MMRTQNRFPDAIRRESEVIDDNPMYIRDYSKCLTCWRCVQVCAEDAQYAFAINFDGRGYETQIGTFFDKSIPETTCVLCGQCVGVCPTGALKSKREYLLEQGMKPEEISVLNTGRKREEKSSAYFVIRKNQFRILRNTDYVLGVSMIKPDRIVTTTCPYCGVGCALNLHIKDDFIYKVIITI